jgi:simple sugar transport system ATP-binding protein
MAATTPTQTPKRPDPSFLEIRGLSKQFGSIQALRSVDLDVQRGEVLGLLGDNGAGKSTFIKCISGVYTPSAGTIHCEGRPVTIAAPNVTRSLGIETVFQDLALIPNLDAAANLFIGRELGWGLKGLLRVMRDKAMAEDVRATLERLGAGLRSGAGSGASTGRPRTRSAGWAGAGAMAFKARALPSTRQGPGGPWNPLINGFQRLRLWWGSRGQSPPPGTDDHVRGRPRSGSPHRSCLPLPAVPC